MTGKKPCILIASKRHAYPRLFAILSDYQLSLVSTFDELQAALANGQFQLTMVGVHFDESRMFDAVHYVRADKTYSSMPIVCFRGIVQEDAAGKRLEAGAQAACEAIGIRFFDLIAFPDDSFGNAEVRKLIDMSISEGANWSTN